VADGVLGELCHFVSMMMMMRVLCGGGVQKVEQNVV